MKRVALFEMLEKYVPREPEEVVSKRDMINFIQENPDCFERSLERGHITGSCWLLNKDHSKALLMHHAKLNQWVQLGGHCDGNPDVLSVALREAQEESGILSISPVHHDIFDIDIHFIPARKQEKEHYHYDVRFLLQVTSDEEAVHNSEAKELRWVENKVDALPAKGPSVIRMVKKWGKSFVD